MRENELAMLPVPWLNNSRKRLLLIWGPFQLIAILFVLYFSAATFSVPPAVVKNFNKSLFAMGVIIQGYFLFIVARDLTIMLTHFFSNDYLGFWKALSINLICIPIDCIVLLVLSTWGAMVMN